MFEGWSISDENGFRILEAEETGAKYGLIFDFENDPEIPVVIVPVLRMIDDRVQVLLVYRSGKVGSMKHTLSMVAGVNHLFRKRHGWIEVSEEEVKEEVGIMKDQIIHGPSILQTFAEPRFGRWDKIWNKKFIIVTVKPDTVITLNWENEKYFWVDVVATWEKLRDNPREFEGMKTAPDLAENLQRLFYWERIKWSKLWFNVN